MDTEKVLEVLRHVEWRLGQRLCPWCHESESMGHDANCNLAALLFDGRAVTTTTVSAVAEWELGALIERGDWSRLTPEELEELGNLVEAGDLDAIAQVAKVLFGALCKATQACICLAGSHDPKLNVPAIDTVRKLNGLIMAVNDAVCEMLARANFGDEFGDKVAEILHEATRYEG